MNKACIVKAHHAGLGSLLNNLMAWMTDCEVVVPDWRDCLYGPETWDRLFEPVRLPDGEYDVVRVHPNQTYTYRNAGHLYRAQTDWRTRLNKQWQKLKPLPRVTGFCDWFVEEYFTKKPVVAALIRAHPSAGEQL